MTSQIFKNEHLNNIYYKEYIVPVWFPGLKRAINLVFKTLHVLSPEIMVGNLDECKTAFRIITLTSYPNHLLIANSITCTCTCNWNPSKNLNTHLKICAQDKSTCPLWQRSPCWSWRRKVPDLATSPVLIANVCGEIAASHHSGWRPSVHLHAHTNFELRGSFSAGSQTHSKSLQRLFGAQDRSGFLCLLHCRLHWCWEWLKGDEWREDVYPSSPAYFYKQSVVVHI